MSKLLFVDDDTLMLKSLKRSLRSMDFECFFATNGFEAINIIRENSIDVILTDMKMPEMNGLELLKKIDQIDSGIVKIVISGSIHMQELIETVNQINIFKYISKPYDVYLDLIPILEEAVDYSKFKKEKRLQEKVILSKNAEYRAALNQLNSDINVNEIGLNILKIYQQIFIESLHKQADSAASVVEQKRFYKSYERFIADFLDEIDSNSSYFKPKILEAALLSLFDGNQSDFELIIENSIFLNHYSEGISSYVKPLILNFIRDALNNSCEDHFKIEMSVENMNDNKTILTCRLSSANDNFSYLVNKIQYNLYKEILATFGDEIEFKKSGKNVEIIIKAKIYRL